MNFDSHNFNTLFEKTLVRVNADFESEMNPRSASSELSKVLKARVSSSEPSSNNFQLKRTADGVYHLQTSFLLYRDSRLVIINLLKWIERNGKTTINCNFFVDLKFMDSEPGPFKGTLFSTSIKIENIEKTKFVLDFDEAEIYRQFPDRRNYFRSQPIFRFEPVQKFIPKGIQDPRMYQIHSTANSGINFGTLIEGYLRMQYIGGESYEKKVDAILKIISQFCVIAWDCVINKTLTQKNLDRFSNYIKSQENLRESYFDYVIFKRNFPSINFTVDLVSDPKVLDSFYQILRDRIYEIISNIEIKGAFDLNYDTSISVFQIKDAKLKCKTLTSVEFIGCTLENGIFTKCDLYDTKIQNALINQSNLFLSSEASKCTLIDCFSNRTTELIDCTIDGMASVLNGKMNGGTFLTGKVGIFANITPNTVVVKYQPLKTGYIVAGDQIIIPTKKFRQL